MSKLKGDSSLPLNIPVSIKTLGEYKAICKKTVLLTQDYI